MRRPVPDPTPALAIAIARVVVLILLAVAPALACGPRSVVAGAGADVGIDSAALIRDISVLSADTMEGRAPGTPGSARARAYIVRSLEEAGVQPFEGALLRSFQFTPRGGTGQTRGINIVGHVRGTVTPDRYIVVTAHYDHLGVRDGETFHGADDNASGTAALLALARHFARQPPRTSIIFAALDAEEHGLRGARALVQAPPVPRESIVLNINMDMISRNERGELYVAGTHHWPFLRRYVERVAESAPVTLRMGHDSPDLGPRDDWTMLSDHGAFHEAGIPFLYFGVEDHPDYHRPTDTFERIQPGFYVRAVETILEVIREVDRDADSWPRR